MAENQLYKIIFHNQGEVYEVHARSVSQGGLFGFVEIADLVFGAKSQVVVDPSEERLKTEFDGVRRVYVPMHAIVRIDEVERPGASRITETDGKAGTVAAFPTPIYDKPRGDR